MPAALRANQGAATISVKVSETSVRHTKLDHSGCSPARIGPTMSHLAATDTPAASAPAASMTNPESRRVAERPASAEQPGEREEDQDADPAGDEHGDQPAELPQRACEAEPGGRVVRAALVALGRLAAQPHGG